MEPWPRGPRGANDKVAYAYLLDGDSDLAERFDLRMRIAARQATTVLVRDVPAGKLDRDLRLAETAGGYGLLIFDGVLAIDVYVGDRVATELVGAGDLLQSWTVAEDELLDSRIEWRALTPVRFAILDAEFTERARPWAAIGHELLRRVGRRAHSLNLQRSIASQPRLEVRLALLLWHLAGRWGRIEPSGVRLTLPLTHALLGRLIAAERPSVSHAFARLVDAGLIRGTAADLHLLGTAHEQVERLVGSRIQRLPGSDAVS